MDSHPQCRCFITPLIPGFTPPASASGETWLAKQDEQTQRNILGGHYDLYKSGTPLGDMVKIKQDKTWGPTVGVRPLKEMAGAGTSAAKGVVPVVPAVPVLPVIPVPIPATVSDVADQLHQVVNFNDGAPDLSKLSLRVAEEVAEKYKKVIAKYPGMAGKFESLTVEKLSKNIYADCLPISGDNIRVNELFFSDVNKFESKYAKDLLILYHPEGTDYKSVVTHEIGHRVDGVLTFVLQRGIIKNNGTIEHASTEIRKLVLKKLKLTKNDIGSNLSGYAAAKGDREFFAEAFAEYIDSDNPRPIAIEFGKILDEFMKDLK